VTYKNFINGAWQISSTTSLLDGINPTNKKIIGYFQNSSEEDVNQAV